MHLVIGFNCLFISHSALQPFDEWTTGGPKNFAHKTLGIGKIPGNEGDWEGKSQGQELLFVIKLSAMKSRWNGFPAPMGNNHQPLARKLNRDLSGQDANHLLQLYAIQFGQNEQLPAIIEYLRLSNSKSGLNLYPIWKSENQSSIFGKINEGWRQILFP